MAVMPEALGRFNVVRCGSIKMREPGPHGSQSGLHWAEQGLQILAGHARESVDGNILDGNRLEGSALACRFFPRQRAPLTKDSVLHPSRARGSVEEQRVRIQEGVSQVFGQDLEVLGFPSTEGKGSFVQDKQLCSLGSNIRDPSHLKRGGEGFIRGKLVMPMLLRAGCGTIIGQGMVIEAIF